MSTYTSHDIRLTISFVSFCADKSVQSVWYLDTTLSGGHPSDFIKNALEAVIKASEHFERWSQSVILL